MAAHSNHCEQAGTATDPIALSDSEEPCLVSDTDSAGSEHDTESNDDALMPHAVLRAHDIYTTFQDMRQIGNKLPHMQLLRSMLLKLVQKLNTTECNE